MAFIEVWVGNELCGVVPIFRSDTLQHFMSEMRDFLAGQPVDLRAFEYLDEEGDRISVVSDEDYQLMKCSFLNEVEQNQILRVYFNKADSICVSFDDAVSPQQSNDTLRSSRQATPDDIERILQSGDISIDDVKRLDLLGAGSSGTVYKGLHISRDRLIAMKSILLDVDSAAQERIIGELATLHKCHSLFIIDFYGAFFVGSEIFICTEFMDGGSLDFYTPIPVFVLAVVAASVVQGLCYLWSLKIMHRDVKPSNILVNCDGCVKLCDFGVSVQLVNSVAKTYVGTNAYMAPERIAGEDYRIHSDVWSFGLSLFEMATGRYPYQESGQECSSMKPLNLMHRILHEDPPHLDISYGAEICDFVAACLRKEAHMRPSPEQLLQHAFVFPHLSAAGEGGKDIVAKWLASRQQSL